MRAWRGGLVDRASHSGRVWNKIPDSIRSDLLDMELDVPELSPRELAVRFTDTKGYFVSESSVYRASKIQIPSSDRMEYRDGR